MGLLEQLIALGLFHWLMLMAPGPDFLLMLRTALGNRLQVAFALAAGIAVAILWHSALVVYAGQPLMQVMPVLQLWLPLLCGGYLLWLAVQGWRGLCAPTLNRGENDQLSSRRAFTQGLLCNLLNPKAYLYFISLLTGVLSADMPDWFKQALVAEFSLLALLWFALLACLLRLRWVQLRLQQWATRLQQLTLLLLGGFGLMLLVNGAVQQLA